VNFIGYNRDHTACFIRGEQAERRAIDLHLGERSFNGLPCSR
jgi:hypothetical protein